MKTFIGFLVLLALLFIVFGEIGLALAFSVILYGIGWLLLAGVRALLSLGQKA
jgi:hypothetical protein